MTLHPIVSRASCGQLPGWAVASSDRREHMQRVADLLGSWAEGLGLQEEDRTRWRAVGYLHDALRDAHPDELRALLPPESAGLADRIVHGPAAAERLRQDGVRDEDVLAAVAFHTTGDPTLGALGQALYAADFLEPGRKPDADWRAELRARMPHEMGPVVLEVLRARILYCLEQRATVPPRTLAFWNTLVSGAP